MPISKRSAMRKFDELIETAERKKGYRYPRYDTEYHRVFYGGDELIGSIFGQDAATKFLNRTQGIPALEDEPLEVRRDHINSSLTKAIALLKVYKTMIPAPEEGAAGHAKAGTVEALVRLADSLPLIIRELGERHGTRPKFEVTDEYDLQDLIRPLLYIFFDDVRKEEGTPSLAGSNGRVDFLLYNEKTAVELKMTSERLRNRELRKQLADDILLYQKHPDCKTLVAIVYDPGNFIENPVGFETDLTKGYGKLAFYVFIVS